MSSGRDADLQSLEFRNFRANTRSVEDGCQLQWQFISWRGERHNQHRSQWYSFQNNQLQIQQNKAYADCSFSVYVKHMTECKCWCDGLGEFILESLTKATLEHNEDLQEQTTLLTACCFMLIGGTILESPSENWTANHPRNFAMKHHHNSRCKHYSTTLTGRWYDGQCHQANRLDKNRSMRPWSCAPAIRVHSHHSPLRRQWDLLHSGTAPPSSQSSLPFWTTCAKEISSISYSLNSAQYTKRLLSNRPPNFRCG